MLKMRAHIVMPKNSSAAKLKAVQGYGAMGSLLSPV